MSGNKVIKIAKLEELRKELKELSSISYGISKEVHYVISESIDEIYSERGEAKIVFNDNVTTRITQNGVEIVQEYCDNKRLVKAVTLTWGPHTFYLDKNGALTNNIESPDIYLNMDIDDCINFVREIQQDITGNLVADRMLDNSLRDILKQITVWDDDGIDYFIPLYKRDRIEFLSKMNWKFPHNYEGYVYSDILNAFLAQKTIFEGLDKGVKDGWL